MDGTGDVSEENARLVKALRDAGRIDELADAFLDENCKNRLLEEFDITPQSS